MNANLTFVSPLMRPGNNYTQFLNSAMAIEFFFMIVSFIYVVFAIIRKFHFKEDSETALKYQTPQQQQLGQMNLPPKVDQYGNIISVNAQPNIGIQLQQQPYDVQLQGVQPNLQQQEIMKQQQVDAQGKPIQLQEGSGIDSAQAQIHQAQQYNQPSTGLQMQQLQIPGMQQNPSQNQQGYTPIMKTRLQNFMDKTEYLIRTYFPMGFIALHSIFCYASYAFAIVFFVLFLVCIVLFNGLRVLEKSDGFKNYQVWSEHFQYIFIFGMFLGIFGNNASQI